MKYLKYLYNYFIYRLKAVNEHGVHSPFVFDLLTNVIYNRNDYYNFKKIENVREQLLNSKKKIHVINASLNTVGNDFGEQIHEGNKAAADNILTSQKKVSYIAKHYTQSAEYSQLLFRLVNHFQPLQIIELGTSFGIRTAYMASVSSKIDIVTIEENSEAYEIAVQNFKQLKLKNIEQITSSIIDALPVVLAKNQNLHFVYFDGNRCGKDILNYFNLCLDKANEASVFVFDNMYLSSEMRDVWDEIKGNIRVTVTLDLFFMGIVFFRKEQAKQHFVIKF